ncbi:hypothetical protein [Virgibacillus halodenitrificans]|uniref:hypothetical protein n=1 Tax=Virgibacillus halodenitrificans TaxID=1482 RepID=UPI000EF45108|nr:hypothetical protein [Virgibacillus halodenitrificans]
MRKEKGVKTQLGFAHQCTCDSRLFLNDDPIPKWFIELKQQEKEKRKRKSLSRRMPIDPLVEKRELEKLLQKYY